MCARVCVRIDVCEYTSVRIWMHSLLVKLFCCATPGPTPTTNNQLSPIPRMGILVFKLKKEKIGKRFLTKPDKNSKNTKPQHNKILCVSAFFFSSLFSSLFSFKKGNLHQGHQGRKKKKKGPTSFCFCLNTPTWCSP